MLEERRRVFDRLVAPLTGGPITPDEAARILDDLIKAAKREQARIDAELMQKLSDRSPTTKPPKNGTNSRAVYATAADILHPDQLGWSLELPDHLKEEADEQES